LTYSEQDQDIYQLAYDLRCVDGQGRVQKQREAGRYSKTGPGARIIQEISSRLLLAIKGFSKMQVVNCPTRPTSPRAKAQAVLEKVDSGVVAAIAVETAVNCVASRDRNTTFKVRNRIAHNIREHFWLRDHMLCNAKDFRRVKNLVARGLSGKFRGDALRVLEEIRATGDKPFTETLVDTDSMILGAVVLELLLDVAPDVFETHQYVDYSKSHKRKNRSYLRFTEAFSKRIHDLEELYAQVTPLHLPITEVPLDWTATDNGGFYSNAVRRRPIMGARERVQLQSMRDSECPAVFKAINTLQRVRWRVNEEVLEVYRCAVDGGWAYPNLDLPPRENPARPSKPETTPEEAPSEWKVYRKVARNYYRKIEEWDQRRAEIARTLALADMYVEKKGHHLVHGIDFRGRIYPTTSALNYQGDELNRALCCFDEAKPIGTGKSLMWFKVHGANTWGEDKLSMDARCQWVDDNRDRIKAVYDDPLDNRWWCEADKPWLFLAWCLEAGAALEDPQNFASRLPVAMDGSANGLQILGLATRCERTAAATNCLPADIPADIYKDVADETTKRLLEFAKNDDKEGEWARGFLMVGKGEVPRKATKRLTMTYVYSATAYSRQGYVSDWYHDEVAGQRLDPPPFPGNDTYSATWWLATVMVDALADVVRSAATAMSWMQQVTDVLSKHNKHLSWVSPTGLRVQQAYRKSTSKIYEISLRRKVKVYTREWSDDVDSRKARSACVPNWVHSIDAAAATLTICQAVDAGVTGFQMIHDSFACHAHDAPVLAHTLRSVYQDIVTDNPLQKLADDVRKQLPSSEELPELPMFGSLDLNQLQDCQYFFA